METSSWEWWTKLTIYKVLLKEMLKSKKPLEFVQGHRLLSSTLQGPDANQPKHEHQRDFSMVL